MPRCSLPGRPAARHPRHARAEVCAARGFPTPPLRAPWPGRCQVGTEKGAKNDLTGKAPYKFWPPRRRVEGGLTNAFELGKLTHALTIALTIAGIYKLEHRAPYRRRAGNVPSRPRRSPSS